MVKFNESGEVIDKPSARTTVIAWIITIAIVGSIIGLLAHNIKLDNARYDERQDLIDQQHVDCLESGGEWLVLRRYYCVHRPK